MPELPEVETVVRGLRAPLTGSRIQAVEVIHEDVLVEDPHRFRRAVVGSRIQGVARRGKNVLLELEPDGVLRVNLGMTGRLLPDPPRKGPAAPTHPALRFLLEGGGTLVYDDVRRFGRVEWLRRDQWVEREREFGPEPLEASFGPEEMSRILSSSRSPVRNLLLDQGRIAGVGNIYANEALFRAGIHPRVPARRLTSEEGAALHTALRDVLEEALASGGTTIRDFRNARGDRGGFSRHLQVYGREEEECLECGTRILRTVFGNRSAYFCPRCQPRDGAEAGLHESPGSG